MNILIINGPNLNLLGKRQTDIYGNQSFEAYLDELRQMYPQHSIAYFQSNCEGAIIDRLHADGISADAIVINAGAYTHTSIAIADAVRSITTPVVEVHISNVNAREDYRRVSYLAEACRGSIVGFGLDSYRLAIEAVAQFNK